MARITRPAHALVPTGERRAAASTEPRRRDPGGRRRRRARGRPGRRRPAPRRPGPGGLRYAVEDRAWWAAELGRDLAPGSFGQNLDTEGLDVTGAVIGERWQVGADGLRARGVLAADPVHHLPGLHGRAALGQAVHRARRTRCLPAGRVRGHRRGRRPRDGPRPAGPRRHHRGRVPAQGHRRRPAAPAARRSSTTSRPTWTMPSAATSRPGRGDGSPVLEWRVAAGSDHADWSERATQRVAARR